MKQETWCHVKGVAHGNEPTDFCLIKWPNLTLQHRKTRHHMLQEARNTPAKVNKGATLSGILPASTTISACVLTVCLQMFHWFTCGADKSIRDVLQAKRGQLPSYHHDVSCGHSCMVFIHECKIKAHRLKAGNAALAEMLNSGCPENSAPNNSRYLV